MFSSGRDDSVFVIIILLERGAAERTFCQYIRTNILRITLFNYHFGITKVCILNQFAPT